MGERVARRGSRYGREKVSLGTSVLAECLYGPPEAPTKSLGPLHHGKTSKLTEQELDDLVLFLFSL